MIKEIIYFCAELLNYWSMTFWGLKLFAKIYKIEIHKNKWVENIVFIMVCMPISWHAAGNYKYTLFTNFLSHLIVLYMYVTINVFVRKKLKISLSMVAFYIYGVRLFDLWIVAVVKEISRVSRHMEFDLIHLGRDRIVFIVILSVCYYWIYNICKNLTLIIYMNENKFYRRIICIYSLLGNFCFSVVYYSNYREYLINYWIFYLVCAFIMVGTCLFYFIGIKAKEKERFLNMRNDMMEANYQGLQKVYETNRTLQHDYKNHLLAIHSLVKDNKKDDALSYISTYIDYSRKSSVEIKSGNDIFDIVINSKIVEAKGKHIDFKYDVDYLGELPIKDIDLCALMANLLDNSIEACEKVMENAWISLEVKRRNDMIIIWLKNSLCKEASEKKSFFQTDKANPQLHGWGMKSIEHVLKKYDGTKSYEINNNQITIYINIPI